MNTNDSLDEFLQPIWLTLRIQYQLICELSEKVKFLEEEVLLLRKELEKVGLSNDHRKLIR